MRPSYQAWWPIRLASTVKITDTPAFLRPSPAKAGHSLIVSTHDEGAAGNCGKNCLGWALPEQRAVSAGKRPRPASFDRQAFSLTSHNCLT